MNWKKAAVALACAVPVIALLAYGLTTDPKEILATHAGERAAGFELKRIDDGTVVRLSDHAGEVVVLNFWASWCVECDIEHPDLLRAARVYQPRGVRFYGVLFNDSPEEARDWLVKRGGAQYASLDDPGVRTSIAYGLRGVPETFVVARDGTILLHKIGIVRYGELAKVLDTALAQNVPTDVSAGAATSGD